MLTVEVYRIGNTTNYELSFLYEQNLINRIKSLTINPKYRTKKYDGGKKRWVVDCVTLIELITLHKGSTDIFFKFENDKAREKFIEFHTKYSIKEQEDMARLNGLRSIREEAKRLKNELLKQDTVELDYSPFLNEGIKPYEYQKVGAIFANKLGKCLFAAEQGTGKTIMGILTTEMYGKDIKKVLVICPNSLKFNWAMEVIKFCGQPYYLLNEKKKNTNKYTVDEAKYFIVNYDYFNNNVFSQQQKINKFGLDKIDMLICDESHKLKNTGSNTVKNILKCFRNKSRYVLLLTGTPMPNKAEELYVQLNFLNPDDFSSKNRFYTEYCGLRFDVESLTWDTKNAPDFERIHEKLDDVMFRVRKKDVLKDLPDLVINKIFLDMSVEQEKEYTKLENEFKDLEWNAMGEMVFDQTPSLIIMNKLRQYTSSIKLDTVRDLITNFNDEGSKVLVFDCFKKPLYALQGLIEASAVYSGDIDAQARQKLVTLFQKPESKDLMNMLITMQSGNFGITLTEASNILVLNQSFVPSENDQCYARAHRIGQKNCVMVYIIIFKNTIDEMIDNVVGHKQIGISKVVDGEEFKDQSNKSTVGELLSLFKQKYS
jgi:SNF2 family DNA or RNA helicase